MASYEGVAVLDMTEPDRGAGAVDAFERDVLAEEPLTGARFVVADDAAPSVSRDFVWMAFDRTEAKAIRDFIDACYGRAIPFWLIAWEQSFTLAVDHLADSINLVVRSCGYAANVFPMGPSRRRLAVRAPGGSFHYRKIINAVDNGNGTETLTLDAAIADALSTATFVSFLRLARLDTDEPRISWKGHTAIARLPIRELPAEVQA